MEQTKSFVEKLTQARSVDKALEIQMEFTKQAYETFVAEMQKIYDFTTSLPARASNRWSVWLRKPRDRHPDQRALPNRPARIYAGYGFPKLGFGDQLSGQQTESAGANHR